MSEEKSKTEFSIQRLYVKDISFESPKSPVIFTEDFDPTVDINLEIAHDELEDNIFNVDLQLTVTAIQQEETVFIAEVKQSGIFLLEDFNDEDLDIMLGCFCPNILFPYAREVISDLATRGGFPPLYLAPVNFEAMYHEGQMEKQTVQ